jgi:hypothetical protein
VIVQLDPTSPSTAPQESILEKPPNSYDKISMFPINVDRFLIPGDEPPPDGICTILEGENLTVENVSHMITTDTFLLWQQNCTLARDTIDDLRGVTYAIVHRYSAIAERDFQGEKYSGELLDSAVVCLALVRPTRRSRAGRIIGSVNAAGMLDPQSFAAPEPAEVPEVQKLFAVRNRDVLTLRAILPEFLQLYLKRADGTLKDDYEPLRMAIQLYEQAYAIHYWKARHILWWAAIESLYGNAQDAAMARIFAFFGNKSLVSGYRCSIYEPGDIPRCYPQSSRTDHTLGEMVPLIYEVRNTSAHGQKVPDSHFSSVTHPFGTVNGIEVLAEAATFVIRKTLTEILRLGFRERFKNRDSSENFWLYEYGLNGKQSRKRLKEMQDSLDHDGTSSARTT